MLHLHNRRKLEVSALLHKFDSPNVTISLFFHLFTFFQLNWLKEKVQELYPEDTVRNVNYQWSRCLDALDTHANKLKNMPFDEYDSSDEY